MLFYRAGLDLSRPALNYLTGVLRRHRTALGSPWHRPPPGRQALLVLVHLRKGEAFAELAAGFGVSTATAWRYVCEAVALLAARAPKLVPALLAARATCLFPVLDGTLIRTDRVAADRPFFSGKHREHGIERAGTGYAQWRSGVGVRSVARQRPRPEGRPHLGPAPPAGHCETAGAGR